MKYKPQNECFVYFSWCGIQRVSYFNCDETNEGYAFPFCYSTVVVIREVFLDTVPNWSNKELQEIPGAYYKPEQQIQSQLLL